MISLDKKNKNFIKFCIGNTWLYYERSLRNSKTKMKVSGQFSNIQNAEYFARIKSYIETCKRNDINIYDALCKLINGEPYKIEDMKID